MNPYRKGLAAGYEYWAEMAEYKAKPFAERAAFEPPVAPCNPYPEPVGKRGAALANSGWRQWDDGFRFAKDRR
ncbi:hypothetical protein [Sphingomonas sp. LK11]|uniref:hypothetical protein n=1 Tax=Sphingomonas sp. LK11 TaxID=1390395 RepID=UPI0012EBC7C9|nr:hypothetical protein [Sphingomonas sp. LK11]